MPGCSSKTIKTPSSYNSFIASIQGNWKGCATRTPVGPRPYDIVLSEHQPDHVTGIATPGPMSDHYWSYQLDEKILWLRFLSTFRGNQRPVWLSAIGEKAGTIIFRSEHVAELKVEVTLIHNQQNIDIYLQEKPHVSIRLTRTNNHDDSQTICMD